MYALNGEVDRRRFFKRVAPHTKDLDLLAGDVVLTTRPTNLVWKPTPSVRELLAVLLDEAELADTLLVGSTRTLGGEQLLCKD